MDPAAAESAEEDSAQSGESFGELPAEGSAEELIPADGGYFYDSDGKIVSADGYFLNSAGEVVSQDGTVICSAGLIPEGDESLMPDISAADMENSSSEAGEGADEAVSENGGSTVSEELSGNDPVISEENPEESEDGGTIGENPETEEDTDISGEDAAASGDTDTIEDHSETSGDEGITEEDAAASGDTDTIEDHSETSGDEGVSEEDTAVSEGAGVNEEDREASGGATVIEDEPASGEFLETVTDPAAESVEDTEFIEEADDETVEEDSVGAAGNAAEEETVEVITDEESDPSNTETVSSDASGATESIKLYKDKEDETLITVNAPIDVPENYYGNLLAFQQGLFSGRTSIIITTTNSSGETVSIAIGANAFKGLSEVTSITIPTGVTSLGTDCLPENLEVIYYDGTVFQWEDISGHGAYDDLVLFNIQRAEDNREELQPADSTADVSDWPVTWPLSETFKLTVDDSDSDDSITLAKDTDYKMTYSVAQGHDGYAKGKATITIKGIGKYYGSNTITLDYSRRLYITNNTKFVEDDNYPQKTYTYTGAEICPDPTLVAKNLGNPYDGKQLEKDRDYVLEYKNNVNVSSSTTKGSYNVVGKDEWVGEKGYDFKIVQADAANVTIDIPDQTYTGSELTPDLTVSLNGVELPDTDYTAEYSNNIEVSDEATVTITGVNNLTGTKTATFRILPGDISGATIEDIPDQTYTGDQVKPSPVVTFGGNTLTEGTDYTVSCSDNINVGTATITITGANDDNLTGTGNVKGTASTTFTIVQADMSGVSIEKIPDQTYTGQSIRPTPAVTFNGKTLVKDTDYKLTYSNNADAGTNAGVNVIALQGGNFTGYKTAGFTINQAEITAEMVADIDPQPYTGDEVKPVPKVTFGEMELTSEGDYPNFTLSYADNVNPTKEAKVTISGTLNFKGEVTKEFYILYDISPAVFDGIEDCVYSGAVHTQDNMTLSLVLDGDETVLDPENDYDVEYTDNVEAGTATVTATGKGNFMGTASETFTIARASISDAEVSGIASRIYNGKAQTQSPIVKLNGTTLKSGTDYSLTYEDNTNVGTATVTITGKGNYTGSISKTFTIARAPISGAEVSGITDRTYNGQMQTQNPTVKLNGTTLVLETDYTLSYEFNMDASEQATVVIAGAGNYTGVIYKYFTIAKASISDAEVSGITDRTYNGQEQTQSPTVELNGTTLTSGTDYTLTYEDNTNAGTATVTATAVEGSNYAGSVSKNFTISTFILSDDNVEITGISSKTYSGSAQTQDDLVVKTDLDPSEDGENLVELKEGQDYTIEYSDNTNVSKDVSFTVIGKGNFAGTDETESKAGGIFTITPAPISDAVITDIADQTYSGEEIVPVPEVTYNDNTVTAKIKDNDDAEVVNYSIAYSDNINAGTATITITGANNDKLTGTGNFKGTTTKTFRILPIAISGASIADVSDQTYTGKQIKPSPAVTFDEKTLEKGTDYTVAYNKNTDAGTAEITFSGKNNDNLTGTGNFKGTATKTFKILPADISGASIEEIPDQTYTGQSIRPTPAVTFNGKTLVKDTDYELFYSNNADAGVAGINVKAVEGGNFTGNKEVGFNIKQAEITADMVADIDQQSYTGGEVKPVPKVTFGEMELTSEGEYPDFTLSYANNVNPTKKAKVTVSGTGNFTGEVTKEFYIVCGISTAVFEGIEDCVYSGAAHTQDKMTLSLVLDGNKIVLDPENDYDVKYTANVDAGTATVTATGKGYFKGTASTTFTIEPADISKADVSGITDKTYSAKEQTQSPTVKVDGNTLTSGTDYELSYENNTDPGTAAVTITGKGNYKNSLSKTFTILKAPISEAEVSGITGRTYNGKAQTQSPTVKVNDNTLKSGTDYSLSYKNNKNAGTATVTITGKGNYKDSISKTFTIAKAAQPITVTAASSEIAVGRTTGIRVSGAKGSKTYASLTSSIASVDEDGKVTAKKVGYAKIKVAAEETANYKAASQTVQIKVLPGAAARFVAQSQAVGNKLTWDKVPGATGYILIRGSSQIAVIKSGNTLTYLDKKADCNNGQYTYKLIATASTGTSPLYRTRSIFHVRRTEVTTIGNTASRSMTVKWKRNYYANEYRINYSVDKTFETGTRSISIKPGSTVSTTIRKLTKGKTYYVRIRTSIVRNGKTYWSAWSPVRSVRITK